MHKVEEYKPKTTLRLENEMADKVMDDYDVDDTVTIIVKGKVVSKSVDSYDNKKRPSMTIEIKSIEQKGNNELQSKLANRKKSQ